MKIESKLRVKHLPTEGKHGENTTRVEIVIYVDGNPDVVNPSALMIVPSLAIAHLDVEKNSWEEFEQAVKEYWR